ncbi:hypothetical protein LEP1GSC170_0255 [Leptospira interrogans serovar Bataviae str. HAI135]|nr:hypothetical protein LEP1GSC170_0255 [Leptospira interrogans serovar Bataviae str. HAI135]
MRVFTKEQEILKELLPGGKTVSEKKKNEEGDSSKVIQVNFGSKSKQ